MKDPRMPLPDRRFRAAAALAVLALLVPAAAGADTRATYQSPKGQESLTVQVKGRMVRVDAPELARDRRYGLYDGARRVFFIVDDGRQEIMELTPEMARRLGAQMRQAAPMLKQLQAQLKKLPPEQRQQLEKRMSPLMQATGNGPTTVFTTRRIGTGRVLGIPCQRQAVLRDGKPEQEVCLARRTDARVPAGDYAAVRAMAETMREMAAAALPVALPMLADVEGIPLEMKDSANGAVRTLKSLSTTPLRADRFKLPPYKVVAFSGLPGLHW